MSGNAYVKVSVAKSGTNPGSGGDKKDKIIIIDQDDILTHPERDSKGIVINDNIVLKPGAYMITIYATAPTIKATSDSEGDPDGKLFTQSVAFEHPGDSVEIREFKANWINRNCQIIIERCTTGKKQLYGAEEAPLQMTTKKEDDKDKNKNTFEFKSLLKGPEVAEYNGTTTFETVTDTVDADATSIDVTNGEGQYQLTDGTSTPAAITTMTNAEDGKVYTVLGSGGAHPSTISGTDFILRNGTAWTALANASITFRAMKTSSSPVVFKFIEQSRT